MKKKTIKSNRERKIIFRRKTRFGLQPIKKQKAIIKRLFDDLIELVNSSKFLLENLQHRLELLAMNTGEYWDKVEKISKIKEEFDQFWDEINAEGVQISFPIFYTR